MTISMREQMAAAMYNDNLRQLNNNDYERATRHGYGYAPTFQSPFDEAEDHVRKVYLSYADAALDTLLANDAYPDGNMAMQVAGGDMLKQLARCSNYDLVAIAVFKAMIRAAKADK